MGAENLQFSKPLWLKSLDRTEHCEIGLRLLPDMFSIVSFLYTFTCFNTIKSNVTLNEGLFKGTSPKYFDAIAW